MGPVSLNEGNLKFFVCYKFCKFCEGFFMRTAPVAAE